MTLSEYLATQFSDLEGAKVFMHKFVNELEQEVPEFGMMSVRCMAAHCSAYLEGIETPTVDGYVTDYLSTKYGTTLYFAAWR